MPVQEIQMQILLILGLGHKEEASMVSMLAMTS